jgi:hypothetical protein
VKKEWKFLPNSTSVEKKEDVLSGNMVGQIPCSVFLVETTNVQNKNLKIKIIAGWYTPIILATKEAEVGRLQSKVKGTKLVRLCLKTLG